MHYGGIVFRSLVLLLAAADLLFRPLLVMANGSVGSYVRFNLQKIWSMCFRRLLLPTVVEYTAPLLRPPQLWSLLLVGTAVVRKTKGRDPVACFNIILFYVEVSVVKGVIF